MSDCPQHPGVEVAGACHRCGSFYCQPEAIALDGQVYCGLCGAREDVDWLGAWGRKQAGSRSGFAWFLLSVGLGVVAWGAVTVAAGDSSTTERVVGVGIFGFGVACALFITGWRWAREALLLTGLAAPTLGWLASDDGFAFLGLLPTLVLTLTAYTDVPTRLFLRVPVPRRQLRKHFDRQGSNPLAITASRLAFVSLVVPGLGLLSLALGVLAWSRVDPHATPPVGNRSAAFGAVLFSLFTLAMWGATLSARAW